MKKKIIFISIIHIAFLLSCNNSSKVKGHWHIKQTFSDSEYTTLDIENRKDSIIFASKYTYNPYSIRHNLDEKQIIFGGCGGFFTYRLSMNEKKIYLKNIQNYGDYIGKKHLLTNSHILEDYQKDLLINVKFPKKRNLDINTIEFKQELLIENIIIGKPKYSKDVFFIDKIRIQVKDKFIDIKEFDDYIKYIKEKYHDKELEHLIFRFILDKNVPTNSITPILDKLKENNFERNYLTCLKLETKKLGDIFEYINLNDLKLNNNQEVYKALN